MVEVLLNKVCTGGHRLHLGDVSDADIAERVHNGFININKLLSNTNEHSRTEMPDSSLH